MANKENNISINPNAQVIFNRKKSAPISVGDLMIGIEKGDRYILSKAITLVESNQIEDQSVANQLIDFCINKKPESLRIGITGTPGVGKSTFIDTLGTQIINENHKLAVLAIDPSSNISRGSILGDKTRMERLSMNLNAYIRPTPSADNLGGVARKTRETMILCEAAGFDTIIIETVGVGQSETAVYQLTDVFLLILQPGAGDELQGIKRGIMEMADILAINKADGERLSMAKFAKAAYTSALHLFQPKTSNWIPKVLTCSSTEENGILDIWNTIQSFQNLTIANNYKINKRNHQKLYWFEETFQNKLLNFYLENKEIADYKEELEMKILADTVTPFLAVDKLIQKIIDKYQK